MNEPTQAPAQDPAVVQAFNENVNLAVLRNFELNNVLIAEGISPTGVALANALSAADLTAAMAVEADTAVEALDVLLDRLFADMKDRAVAAYEYFKQQKAEAAAAAVGA